MALDFFAIVSNGTYPTPTPSGTLRAALAVSYGLLNIALPASVITAIDKVFSTAYIRRLRQRFSRRR
jgi:hypothetical protein